MGKRCLATQSNIGLSLRISGNIGSQGSLSQEVAEKVGTAALSEVDVTASNYVNDSFALDTKKCCGVKYARSKFNAWECESVHGRKVQDVKEEREKAKMRKDWNIGEKG